MITARPTPRSQTACIVAHSYLEQDPRVRREAEALLAADWSLDIICLRAPGEPFSETWSGARVYHLPIRRHRGQGLVIYALEYLAFFALATLLISTLTLGRRYRLVQAHNVPDVLVFTALLPRLLGARVLLDIRDPLPDLYRSKFGGDQRHPVVRLTRWLEGGSTAFADHVLTPGEPSRQRLIARQVPPAKVTNILNSADPRLFQPPTVPAANTRARAGLTLVYHGGLYHRYGLDLAIHAVHQLRTRLPDLRLLIAGEGEEAGRLRQLVAELELDDRVELAGWIAPAAIPAFVARGELGVIPYRQDSFTDLIYPTKAFECIALGKPVIMPRLAGIAELFPAVPDLFFTPDDVAALAAHIHLLATDPARRQRLATALQRAYAPYSWEGQRRAYLSLIQTLTRRPALQS